MAVLPGAGPGALGQAAPFRDYLLDQAYDEMFGADGAPRPQYTPLVDPEIDQDAQQQQQQQ